MNLQVAYRVALAAVLGFASLAHAQRAEPSDDEIARQSAEILAGAEAREGVREIAEAAPRTAQQAQETYREALEAISGTAETAVRDGMEMFGAQGQAMLEATGEALEADGGPPLRYRVFVSQSMPREEVRQLVELSRERKDLAVVFRGVKPGQTINEVFEYILDVMGGVQEGDAAPSVSIDPEPFRAIGTLMVPTLARYDEDENLVAYVSGLTSVEWLDDEVARGRRGNIGQYGSVVEAVEEDMIAAMQAAAEKVQTEGAGERAVNRYFDTLHQEVAVAQVRRVRDLDPSFVVEETITLPTGETLVEAGTVINPLAEMPFTSVLVVFDPTDPRQIEVAKAQAVKHEGKNVMLLASSLSHAGGMEGYAALVEQMQRHIYFLTKEVRDRFDIQVVPAVVTASGLKFQIEEIPPQ